VAQVAGAVHQHIELLLADLIDVWERLPEIEREIDHWDLTEQIVFIEEWPLREQRLARLAEYTAASAMTPEQLGRYHDLLCLVERNRSIVDRLRAS
jgi:hypothetical protein